MPELSLWASSGSLARVVLGVPVSFFFDGLDKGAEVSSPDDVLAKRETLIFVRAYYRIGDPAVRKGLRKLVQAMANLP